MLRYNLPCQKSSSENESGVSLLELALFLPVIILFVAGIIDYGSALREVQAISSASREGARIAASHARINRTSDCNASSGSSDGTCGNGSSFTIANSDAVSVAAFKASCSFIANSGLNGSDWDVNATVPAAVPEDGTSFQVVTVKVQKSVHAKKCILCWDRLLEAFETKAESTFTLESPCAG